MGRRTRNATDLEGTPAAVTEVVDSEQADTFEGIVQAKAAADPEFLRQWTWKGKGRR